MADSHRTTPDLVRLHEQCSAAAAELYEQLERIAPFALTPTAHNTAVLRQAHSHIGAAAAVLRQILP